MTVVITHGIRRKEFSRGVISPEDLGVILGAYAKGISVSIKGEALPKGSRLVKLYATTASGARRIVYLVMVDSGTGFLLFYRSKNDEIGKNITIKNPVFKRKLMQYLDLLKANIASGDYTTYEVQ